MTPHAFIAKWRDATLKERSAAQEHFLDLCRLLDEPTPAEADPTGATYCFERGAVRTDTGGDGWADVWKRHCFAWEYKGQRANLDAAFMQLQQYALALENPPLLIVSDLRRFRIRTNWTNSVSRTYEFDLDDLTDGAVRDRLKWAFSDPERLRPGETRRALTERAAAAFAAVAQTLRARGHDPPVVAHFVNRLVFCMFADDVGLLPDHMFTRMLRQAQRTPAQFTELAAELFRVMAGGGRLASRRSPGSTADCSTTVRRSHWRPLTSRRYWRRRTSTGRRSIRRSSARCSSAGSTLVNARNSARTIPTATRSCCSLSRW